MGTGTIIAALVGVGGLLIGLQQLINRREDKAKELQAEQEKKALKAALRSWLPESVLYRPKMGFAMPLKKWLRGDLGRLFGENHDNGFEDVLDGTLLQKMISLHSSEKIDLTSPIHSLFFFKNWLDKWA